MKEKKFEVLELIEKYQLKSDSEILTKLIQKVLTEDLKRFEYIQLYQEGNKLLKNLVILKAPIEVLLNILITETEFEFYDSLSKRIEENPDKFEFINFPSCKIRICAAKYISEDKLIERLLIEKENMVIEEIFLRLKDYTFSESEVDKLINADSWRVRVYMVDFVSSKKRLAERLLIEKDQNVSAKIMELLGNYKFSVSEADKLMDSTYFGVREYAARYASKNKLIEVLKTEGYLDVISSILAKLGNYKISEQDANILVDAWSIKFKSFGIKYASEKKLVEMLLVESFRSSHYFYTEANYSCLVSEIFTRLKNYQFSEIELEKLINAPSWFVRREAIQYVPEKKLIERLLVEKEGNVVDEILARLKEYKFSEDEADKLIQLDSPKVIVYVVKYASRNMIIEKLLKEKNKKVIAKILAKLEDYKFSKEDADKLMEAHSRKVREYAVKYASKDKLIEKLVSEKSEKVVLEIFKRFS